MPGIGVRTAARILLDVGDGTAFPTSGHLADDGVDPGVVADRVRAAGLGTVSTVADWVRSDVDQRQQDGLRLMPALLGMATLYTLIAMVNAVVISAADRRAEFAAARLTGLTRRQVVCTTLWGVAGRCRPRDPARWIGRRRHRHRRQFRRVRASSERPWSVCRSCLRRRGPRRRHGGRGGERPDHRGRHPAARCGPGVS
jgi:hypothetical protein